jgi:hypothetical protein
MARHHIPSSDDRDETIKHLRRELENSRIAFIEIMPDDMRTLLWSYFRCESRQEAYAWPKKIAEELVSMAEAIKSPFGERAICPLCRSEGGSQYETGYSLPIGLVRHLTGFGNVRECPVMSAARAVARDYWNEKFSPAERLADAEKTKVLQKRLATETLFSPGPDAKPELYDNKSVFAAPRNPDERMLALSRLEALHFHPIKVGNVESFVDDRVDYIIYADPRVKGNIDFKAYRRLASSTAKEAKAKFALIGNFRIPDRWKNDLDRKYQEWLTTTIADSEKKHKKPNTSS